MIGIKHKDAIKLNDVPLVNRENYTPKVKLPENGLYRYLLQSGEEHDDRDTEQWIGCGLRNLHIERGC